MLLNLLRVENADPEYMIRKSFFQYQNELVAPRIQKEIDELQTRIDSIHVENEKMIFTVYQMRQAAEKLNLQIHAIAMTPKYILPFLQNGRLIHVKVCLMKRIDRRMVEMIMDGVQLCVSIRIRTIKRMKRVSKRNM